MEIRSDDFQSVYRRYAYPLYREVFEELKDIEATREIVYRVFSRLREEGLEDGFGVEERIHAYRLEYVTAQKRARLSVDRVWYQMQNDEILGRTPAWIVAETAETGTVQEQTEDVVVAAEPAEVPPQEIPEAILEETSVPPQRLSMDELLREMENSARRPRRIREVFPEDEEEVIPSETEHGAALQEILAAAEELETMEITEEVSDEAVLPKKAGWGVYFCWTLLILVVILFLWIFFNIIMSMEIVPFVDLGYSWFNENVVTMFPIPTVAVG